MPKPPGDLHIIHEDADILVIDKPPGLLTSTVPREPRPTALAILREHLSQSDPGARLGLIHRLDRDASGLLVFSKHHDAFRALKEQFFKHTVDRIYTAVVIGNLKPDKARMRSRLVEHADGSVHSTKRSDHGEEAITDYQVIRKASEYSLVRVKLFTGRKHQIRAHLAERGAPIVGDRIYGPEGVKNASRLLLAATELSLDHPRTGKRVHFKLEMPEEIRRLFR